MELISGMWVSLGWGNVKTDLLERGNNGVPQGSLEGMWNFCVYSDNIHDAILNSGRGISVSGENVRAVIYADDISPITVSTNDTNTILQAIFEAGAFNSYKFKPSKCKVVGPGRNGEAVYKLGDRLIDRVDCGLLLGAVIDSKGLCNIEHVRRRAKMVETAIRQLKSWRTKGLPFRVAFRYLFIGKLVPRFTYAFSLLHWREGCSAFNLVQKTLHRAMCSVFGWSVPKRFKVKSGIWCMVCGFPNAFALLRKLKLEWQRG